jgi:hypothetical protein
VPVLVLPVLFCSLPLASLVGMRSTATFCEYSLLLCFDVRLVMFSNCVELPDYSRLSNDAAADDVVTDNLPLCLIS